MELWNIRNLEPPSEDFCAYDANDVRQLGNVANLVGLLSNTAREFGPQNVVWAEIKLFQAMKKRIALSQSHDKFYKYLQQIDHCVRNFSHMNMAEVFKNLAKKFVRFEEYSSVIHFPSRQQLEFVFIQCQGASKLLCQTQNYIFLAFSSLVQTLGVGHVLQKLLMVCAVIARISIMLRYLLIQICNTYCELLPWLHKLKEGKWKWDPSLSLPEDLQTWLGPEELKFQSNIPLPASVPFLNKLFRSEEDNVISPQQQPEQKPHDEIPEDMDFGEVVSRPVTKETSSCSSQLCELKKTIMEAESLKSLQLLWKQIFVEQKPELISMLPSPPHLKTKKKVKKLIAQLKDNVAVAKEKKQKNKVKKLVKHAGSVFMSYLGIQDGGDSHGKHENSIKDREVQEVANVLENAKPVRTLKELHKLHKFLCSTPTLKHNCDLKRQLQEMYDENFNNATLLKNAGDIKFCRKLILITSKKMISMCKENKLCTNVT